MREWVLQSMPRITKTEFGNLNYEAEVTARLKNSTFFVSDADVHQNRISVAEAESWG